tara:strand:- start:6844 stop:7410 length:567 start_codon:yes stop_codon:yes gene_type:complete
LITKIRILFIMTFFGLAFSDYYKEPNYRLIKKEDNIEIRYYSDCVIARTSIAKGASEMNNSMFRTLAGYIFGSNEENQSMPMTTPVITREKDGSYDMIFFMLDVNDVSDLPEPIDKNVYLENIDLGKTIVIQFSWWASDTNIKKYKKIIEAYIKQNNIELISEMMVAQYNPPWSWPFTRRNELIFQIK